MRSELPTRRDFLKIAAATAATPFAIRFAGNVKAEGAPLETTTETPFIPPTIRPIRETLASGEGEWNFNLPQFPDKLYMAIGFVKPDREKDYPVVTALVLDHTKIKLNMTVGTADGGKGRIPDEDRPRVKVTTAGGWKIDDGDFGMVVNGRKIKDLKNGRASLVFNEDGSVKIGNWGGEGFNSLDGVSAVRQNGLVLLKDGELTPDALRQGDPYNWKWYINNSDSEYESDGWRSAVGLTANGDIILATGQEVTARTLMEGMQAFGTVTAMQMDLNSPHVHMILYDQDGQPIPQVRSDPSMDLKADLGTRDRDILYVTLNPTT